MIWPKGIYRITSTVTTGTAFPGSGIKHQGEGRSVSDAITSNRVGAATILRWDGPVGGTMIEVPSSVGLVFENMTLLGKTSAVATNKAGILLHLLKVNGYGSGSHSFRDMDFQHADVGVQVMSVQADTNGDTCGFNHTYFYECDTGFLAKNDQALGFQFDNLYGTNCRTVINMERGGHIGINMANFNGCGGTDPDNDYCIRVLNSASNTQVGVFINVKAEGNTKGVAQFKGYGRYTFIAFNEGHSDQNCRQFDTQGCMVIFDGCRFVTQDNTVRPFRQTRDSGGRRSGMIFRDCNFAITTGFVFNEWVEVEANTAALCRFNGCTAGLNDLQIMDFATQPEWGPVVHYGQTTGSTPRNIYLDGSVTATTNNGMQTQANAAYIFDVYIVGKQQLSANHAVFHRRVAVVNNGGTLTMSTPQVIGTDVNAGTWACTLSTSASTLRANVTGVAAATIDWTATFVGRRVGGI